MGLFINFKMIQLLARKKTSSLIKMNDEDDLELFFMNIFKKNNSIPKFNKNNNNCYCDGHCNTIYNVVMLPIRFEENEDRD